jgi:hypothetical protein
MQIRWKYSLDGCSSIGGLSVGIVSKQFPEREDAPIGRQFIECHMIFVAKLDGFCQKACMVVGGHMAAAAPAVMTYASAVLQESAHIASTIAALNEWLGSQGK